MINSCKICGQNADGSHFGVISCRACAAFFRRYAHSKLIHAKCKTVIKISERCFCRPCRLQRCISAGMDSKKFQYNRDVIVAYQKKPLVTITPSVSIFTGQPEFLKCKNSPNPFPRCFIDLNNLIFEAKRLLNHGPESPFFAENQLKKMALNSNLLKFDSKNIKVFQKFGKEEYVDIVEFYFITTLKWFLQFDEFQKLDNNLKITLLNSFWLIWIKFHKCSSTADFRRQNKNAKPSQVVMRNMCMDRDKSLKQFDPSWASDYPIEYVSVYMESQNIYEFEVMESLQKLEPTDVELTYMFAQACLEYTGNRFHGEIEQITDQFQEVLANDLHNYYVNERRNPRYFHRLADLMKVNNLVQKSIWESRPHRELNKVFEVLKIGYSHPEMFEDSEFC